MVDLTASPLVDHAALFAAATTAQLVLDLDLVVVDVNDAYLRATGRSREELLGEHVFTAFPDLGAGDGGGVRALRSSIERARDCGRADTVSLHRYDVVGPDGTPAQRWWSAVNVPVADSAGATALVLHQAQDVTDYVLERQDREQQRALQAAPDEDLRHRIHAVEVDLVARVQELQVVNEELRWTRDQLSARAVQDPLTGLPIRPVFLLELSHALHRQARHRQPLAVLFLDLDRLKHVNDSFGHSAGDQLIRCFVHRLQECLRPVDQFARIGGDEFVVLLEDLQDDAQAACVAERVLARLREPCGDCLPIKAQALDVVPTASIGLAVHWPVGPRDDGSGAPQHAGPVLPVEDQADVLIAHADAAMYRAKRLGGGCYELFDPDAYQRDRERDDLEVELRNSLALGQLRVHYQPIVDLGTGQTYAVEALLRWQHPTRGLLAAGEFVDLAEQTGLIVELDAWTRVAACRQLAAWDRSLGPAAPSRVFVNTSAAEMSSPELAGRVEAAAAGAGVDPKRMVLEITETGILDTTAAGSEAIDAVRRLGCALAIDDFGTGYSSLARLVELPADVLKLDQSLVRDVHRPQAAAVVSAVLLLGHNLHKTVIAEGVEDENTLRSLRELGCSYGQGFHLARPAPA